MEKRLMSIKSLAHYLDMSTNAVQKKVKEGVLPEPKFKEPRFVRWDRHEVDIAIGTPEDPVLKAQKELMESLK